MRDPPRNLVSALFSTADCTRKLYNAAPFACVHTYILCKETYAGQVPVLEPHNAHRAYYTRTWDLSLRCIGIYIQLYSRNVIFALAELHVILRAERKCSYCCYNTLDENVPQKKIVFREKRKKKNRTIFDILLHASGPHVRTCIRISMEILWEFYGNNNDVLRAGYWS